MDKNRLIEKLGVSWYRELQYEFAKPYMKELSRKLATERASYNVYPSRQDVFRAYKLSPYDQIKAVWLGQDPYPGEGQATGLSFDCSRITPKPRSWQKILAVYDKDYPTSFNVPVMDGDCSYWASQGVFMLNTALTVRAGQPGSHIGHWKEFILATLEALEKKQYIVYIALGKYAQEYLKNVTRHTILSYEHPAYAARQGRPWDAEGIFHTINKHLTENNVSPIDF